MKNLNYTVEVEIDNQWVHAQCATIAEAHALKTALDTINSDIINIVDCSIYINKNATNQATIDFKNYQFNCATEILKKYNLV
jgi:hypothetical protein